MALVAPSLTVIIAHNYQGRQQGQAIGFLASAIPLAQVVSLLIAGAFSSSIGWRWSFVLLAVLGIANITLSFRLPPIPPRPEVVTDFSSRGAVGDRHHPAVGRLQLPEHVGPASAPRKMRRSTLPASRR